VIPTKTRALAGLLACCLTALGTALLPATAASALPLVVPTLDVLDAADQPAAAVGLNDPLSVAASSPITVVGQTDQEIETGWDPAAFSLSGGSVVSPEGWNLEYTADGDNWSTNAPSLDTISGVRTAGTVDSGGTPEGLQVSTATGTGTVQGAASFAGTFGGDGWDAFATVDYVLNVWHHDPGAYNLDCHLKSTGSACPGLMYTAAGYQTSRGSSGAVVGSKVYSATVRNSDHSYGVLCTDISARPFTPCGYTSLLGGSPGFSGIGTQTLAGTRVYFPAYDDGGLSLLCFDTAGTPGPCTGQPYVLSGYSATIDQGGIQSYSTSVDGYVFVTANTIWCVDAATGVACPGDGEEDWPAGSFGGDIHAAVPMRDTEGLLTGVCMIRPASACYNLDSTAATYPPTLATLLAAQPVGAVTNQGYGQFIGTATRQFWLAGGYSGGSQNPAICYDWLTQAACTGFSNATTGVVRYALSPDATNPRCIWTNGDNAMISSFDAITGAAGCPDPDPTVLIPYATAVPRMGCTEAGRVRGYEDLTLTAPGGVSLTAMSVTILDQDGAPVTGFSDLHPDSQGVVDLSGLSEEATGTRPAIKVVSPATSTANAAQIAAAVRYVSDPPQLCLTLVTIRQCPTLAPGVSAGSTVPVADAVVNAVSTASTMTITEAAIPTTLAYTVTRAGMTGCLGSVSGVVTRTFTGGTALLPGVTVTLVNPDDSVAATTVTDADGAYSFLNVNPAAYTVALGEQALSRTVTAVANQTADFTVPVENPTAQAVSSSTLQNTPVTLAVNATADPATSIDPTSTMIRDPESETWGTTLTVAGQGTWVVTLNGSLRFTPLAAFIGLATPVVYQVSDGYGTTATANAVVAVLPVAPTAAPVTASGVRGDTLRITLNGTGPRVPLLPASARLVDPVSTLALATVVVVGVGTYTLDSESGEVVFTPLGTFTGTTSVIYQVTDAVGRTARSTITVTLAPITVTGGTRTVWVNHPAVVTIGGVPAHSTVTAPATVEGAAVTVTGGNVRLMPPANTSGVFTVPVTVTHGTATLSTTVVVNVEPAVTADGWYGLLDSAHTIVRWAATPGATGYRLVANGHLICTTGGLTCTIGSLLGPRALITVTTLGTDGLSADPILLDYRPGRCKVISSVYFGPGSTVLSRFTTPGLNAYSNLLLVQGFRSICLAGHTDSLGSAAYNLDLSKRRVAATGAYVGARVRGLSVARTYRGEDDPSSSNGSAAGQALNRRVDLGIA
jgi:CshA-type fibril repeat protein